MMHKHSRKQLPSSFSLYFATVNAKHTRTTRLASSDFNLFLPRYRNKKIAEKLQISRSQNLELAIRRIKNFIVQSIQSKI